VAILLYEPKHKRRVSTIERESGVKFEHISAPQPADIAESAGSEAAEAITKVSDRSVFFFANLYLCTPEVCTFAVLSKRRLFLNLNFEVLDYLLWLQCGTSFPEASRRSSKFLGDDPCRVTGKSTC
jgi:hypothetical protein